MTEAEYFNTEFEVTPDFVEGVIEERNVGGPEHTNWQRALMRWFLLDHGFQPLIAATEVTIRVMPGHHRVADLAVFRRAPHGTASVITDTPLVVIEILSPSDSYRRLKARLQDYEAMGVRNLFVVESRTEITRFQDGRFIPAQDRSALEGSDGFIDWKAAAELLWPVDAD